VPKNAIATTGPDLPPQPGVHATFALTPILVGVGVSRRSNADWPSVEAGIRATAGIARSQG
jgi:hypothetical protein